MEKIAVVGLGYVGLPVAVAFAGIHDGVIAYDNNAARIGELRGGVDRNGDLSTEVLAQHKDMFTSKSAKLADADFYVMAVPTPIDTDRNPDLRSVVMACELIGSHLSRGNLVVLESTVYPGVTEEVCGPVLARVSGLKAGKDFHLGYSPERINPGDREHKFSKIMKVVAADSRAALDRMIGVYDPVIDAGLHIAPTIKTAEAAKVLENTQRDLNVALMNELAIICDKLGIITSDVLAAARTKWNFLAFTPGLVGGHCIGVDPYYLTARAEQLGYVPQVILAGRRINDSMGAYVASKLLEFLKDINKRPDKVQVGVLGLSFKENVSDIRNSRVMDIIAVLRENEVEVVAHDPLVDPLEVKEKFGVQLSKLDDISDLDGIILAVPHAFYLDIPRKKLRDLLSADGIFIDVKSVLSRNDLPETITYWSL